MLRSNHKYVTSCLIVISSHPICILTRLFYAVFICLNFLTFTITKPVNFLITNYFDPISLKLCRVFCPK